MNNFIKVNVKFKKLTTFKKYLLEKNNITNLEIFNVIENHIKEKGFNNEDIEYSFKKKVNYKNLIIGFYINDFFEKTNTVKAYITNIYCLRNKS